MDSINKNQISSEQYFIGNPFWSKVFSLEDEQRSAYLDTINSLPENIKNLMYSVDVAEIIIAIGEKNNLNNWQINRVAIATAEIMSAQIPINQFIPNISQELNLPIETARAIAQEINIKIFSKAALHIKRLQDKRFNFKTRNPKPEIQNPNSSLKKIQRQPIFPKTHKPEERIVNLQKQIDEKPKFVESGPKVEGNVVDLSS